MKLIQLLGTMERYMSVSANIVNGCVMT